MKNYFDLDKIKKEYRFSFISTFIIFFIVHAYKATNNLPNNDSIYNFYSDQNIIPLGRWALTYSCGFSSYYDLPWTIAVLSGLAIAMTSCYVIAIFNIKDNFIIILVGALLCSSPATTETLFFQYTADGYFIAMLLATIAIYYSCIDRKKTKYVFLSSILLCLSCAIYQAYISFALILSILYFMILIIENKFSRKTYIKWIKKQILIYTSSLGLYYVIWRILLHTQNIKMPNYQGISGISPFRISSIVNGIYSSIYAVKYYFFPCFDICKCCLEFYDILSFIFILSFFIGLFLLIAKYKLYKDRFRLFLFVLCIISIVPCSAIWNFASSKIFYRPMMLQCLTLLFIFSLAIHQYLTENMFKRIQYVLITIIVMNNSIIANIAYFYMDISQKRTFVELTEMAAKIHDYQSSSKINKIIILGSKSILHFSNKMNRALPSTAKIPIFHNMIYQCLSFNSDHIIPLLDIYYNIQVSSSTKTERNRLLEEPRILNMPSWPDRNSICIIDNNLIIKLGNTKEW